MAKWQFSDTETAQSYTFEISPREGGNRSRKKNIQTQSSLSGTGQTILYEGRDEVESFDFSGVLLTQAQHDAFIEWFNKRNKINVTDEAGNTTTVYITEYSPTRGPKHSHLDRKTYNIRALVIED